MAKRNKTVSCGSGQSVGAPLEISDEWLKIIEQDKADNAPPDGWIDAKQYGELINLSRDNAKRRLDKRVAAGEIKSTVCRVNGKPTTYYGF